MSDLSTYNIYALSERAALFELGNTISEAINNKILAMHKWLLERPFGGLKDMVPAYSSLTILYDPFIVNRQHPASTPHAVVKEKLEAAWLAAEHAERGPGKNISVPVCYDPEFGPDLELVAAAKNLSVDEVVSLHYTTSYRVYMLGFLPGFAYMGRVHEQLVMPRRALPRDNVPAGSVGIAGWQTGIYPLNSPGGWQLIGRTPLKLFDPNQQPPVLLAAGDTVNFYPVTLQEFESLKQ